MDTETVKLLLWDADGNEMNEEFPPPAFLDLLGDSDNLPFGHEEMITKLEELSGSKVVALYAIAYNHYRIFDALTVDDGHLILHVLNTNGDSDPIFFQDRFRRECDVMAWISSSTKIPIPRIHYYANNDSAPYMIMDKCKGKILADTFGHLPFEAKVASIHSYAHIAIELFCTDAPNGIGSISLFTCDAVSGSKTPVLGPSVLDFNPPTVVPSINDYFKWFFEQKLGSTRIGTSEQELDEARLTLKRLENLVFQSISGYDSALLRSVPSHEDFGPQNVFIDDEGVITGVIDWEYHMVKPAILAVAYPYWIRYDGLRHPQSVDKASAFWFSSPSDAAKLRRTYDEIANEMDPEYYRALKAGEFCRAAREWLASGLVDPGCRLLKAWLDSL